jgi:hypothetical protein
MSKRDVPQRDWPGKTGKLSMIGVGMKATGGVLKLLSDESHPGAFIGN